MSRLPLWVPANAITIGNFDGVHLGHKALVDACKTHARAHGGKVIALTFDPHPSVLLRPQHTPQRLTTFAQRRDALLAAGADDVVRLEPTPALLDKSAAEFLGWVLDEFKPGLIAEGEDFHFGKHRSGNVHTMRAQAAERGCDVQIVAGVEVTLNDHAVVRASSSLVRWLLSHGRVADAGCVLGRQYEFVGTVQQGDRLGRQIQIPTANVVSECLMPMNGAYAGMGVLPDGTVLPAAINVGMRPTVNGVQRRVEVHLLREASGGWTALPGLPEYGWELRVRFAHFLRDEMKFPGLPALLGQIQRDIARVRGLITPRVGLAGDARVPANA